MGANIGLTREYIDPEKKILRLLCQRYELKEEVGKGAHGQIFSGKDKISRQPIAIKIVNFFKNNYVRWKKYRKIRANLFERFL
jgi:serine/threonine protein kinase